jgi:CheY-like chemotaxis protein
MTRTLPPQRILVVDDEPSVREAVKLLLTFDGHQVETAGCGEEGLASFASAQFDLIITDHKMPMMTGAEFAQRIKQRAPTKPIIMLTAFAPELQPSAIDLIVHKPCRLETLREAIATVLGWKVE